MTLRDKGYVGPVHWFIHNYFGVWTWMFLLRWTETGHGWMLLGLFASFVMCTLFRPSVEAMKGKDKDNPL